MFICDEEREISQNSSDFGDKDATVDEDVWG